MAGIDARTGKAIEEPEHIRQSIETILTTPVGSRVMRREFGFSCLDASGQPRPETTKDEAESAALDAVVQHEPRIRDVAVEADVDDGLSALKVAYTEIKTGSAGHVVVSFPRT